MRIDTSHTTGTCRAAHELHSLGYHLVPCEFGTKLPEKDKRDLIELLKTF